MARIDAERRELTATLAVFGASRAGKSSVLRAIHDRVDPERRTGDLPIGLTPGAATLLDWLMLDLGRVAGWHVRVHLYAVPPHGHADATRRLVLAEDVPCGLAHRLDAHRPTHPVEEREPVHRSHRSVEEAVGVTLAPRREPGMEARRHAPPGRANGLRNDGKTSRHALSRPGIGDFFAASSTRKGRLFQVLLIQGPNPLVPQSSAVRPKRNRASCARAKIASRTGRES